jgi:uncharacterized membrane protein YGL010W
LDACGEPGGEEIARQRLRRIHGTDGGRDGLNVTFDTLFHNGPFENPAIVPPAGETPLSTIADTAAQPASARKVDQLLAHYGESHRNPRNEAIHYVAIPLILLSLVGLLYAAHPWIAYVFLAASMVYYARLSWVFLVSMAVVSAAALLLVFAMGERVVAICTAIFVAAWIAQFIGHKIEGRKPSFLTDLTYLLIGPAWVVAKGYRKLGLTW